MKSAWRMGLLAVMFCAPSRGDVPDDPAAASPPPRTVRPTKADQEPYASWKTHTGAASDAVVHVRMRLQDPQTGAIEVREGSGFVVRCDGFVMVPMALLNLVMTPPAGAGGAPAAPRRVHVDDKAITLTFAAGSDNAAATPAPPQTVPWPRFWEMRRDYVLVKVNERHFRSLPLLDPHKNLAPGRAVRVVYAVRDKEPGRARAVVVPAVVGEPLPAKQSQQRWRFAGEPPRVPPGAVVVDAASGLALGIVPGTAAEAATPRPAPFFASFSDFHQISNAVGLLPDPEAGDKGTLGAAATQAREGMVHIPGGPVELTDWFRAGTKREYELAYGVDVACTPGFWIDRHEVTREEYRQFVAATGHRPLPASWRADALHQPLRGGSLPIRGVRPEDAEAFAAWKGKRLVTPVEWTRAARLADLPPLGEAQAALAQVNNDLRRLDAEDDRVVRAALARAPRQSVRGASAGNILVRTVERDQIDAQRRAVVEAFLNTHGFLVAASAAGTMPGDESIYGVRDVIANVPEWLQQNYGKLSRDVTPKPLMVEKRSAFDPLGKQLFRFFGQNPEDDLRLFGTLGNSFRCAR